jgi:hypothetical protein
VAANLRALPYAAVARFLRACPHVLDGSSIMCRIQRAAFTQLFSLEVRPATDRARACRQQLQQQHQRAQ